MWSYEISWRMNQDIGVHNLSLEGETNSTDLPLSALEGLPGRCTVIGWIESSSHFCMCSLSIWGEGNVLKIDFLLINIMRQLLRDREWEKKGWWMLRETKKCNRTKSKYEASILIFNRRSSRLWRSIENRPGRSGVAIMSWITAWRKRQMSCASCAWLRRRVCVWWIGCGWWIKPRFFISCAFFVFLEAFNSADKVEKAETCRGFQEYSQIYSANIKRMDCRGDEVCQRSSDVHLRVSQLMWNDAGRLIKTFTLGSIQPNTHAHTHTPNPAGQ